MRRASQPRRRDRGAAAVELAIVFPLLFLVLAGVVDFGRYMLGEIQVTNAAREGARIAVIDCPAGVCNATVASDATTRAKAAAPTVTGLVVSTTTNCAAAAPADTLSVKASDPTFKWIILGPAMSLFSGSPGTATLSSTAVMRCGK